MRGSDIRTGELFSYVDLEERVPKNHPLRLIRRTRTRIRRHKRSPTSGSAVGTTWCASTRRKCSGGGQHEARRQSLTRPRSQASA
jgi:hypothetical protein